MEQNCQGPAPSTSNDASTEEIISKVLHRYGRQLRMFRFDKAKEITDEFCSKRLHDSKNSNISSWAVLLQSLGQISMADRDYFQLSFLLPKMFFRKEPGLQKNYTLIADDLTETINNTEPSLVQHILSQCRCYVAARTHMIQLYITLANTADKDWDEMHRKAAEAYDRAQRFSHPMLTELANLYLDEVDLLRVMLRVQCQLVDGNLIGAIAGLKDVRNKFQKWLEPADEEPARNILTAWLFSSKREKCISRSRLMAWLMQFDGHLKAKITLYYGDTFGTFCNAVDLEQAFSRTHMLPAAPNYRELAQDFQRKRDVLHFYIIMDRRDRDDVFHGFRYIRNVRRLEDLPKGAERVFGVQEKCPIMMRLPINYEPNAQKIHRINDPYHQEIANFIHGVTVRRVLEANELKKTFICERIEEDIFAVVVLDGVKGNGKADPAVAAFLAEFATLLRGHRLFQSLKHAAH